MGMFLKATAAVLLAVVMILTLSKQGNDMAVLLGMAVCCMVALIAMEYLQPVMDLLKRLESQGQLDSTLVGILLKATGIGILSEIAAMICADAGKASLGKSLQLLGTVVILWMAIPLFTQLLELIQQILGEL